MPRLACGPGIKVPSVQHFPSALQPTAAGPTAEGKMPGFGPLKLPGRLGKGFAFLLAFSWLLWAAPLPAQTNSGPQILFLHLKLTNQVISLVEANVRPGVLKPASNSEADGVEFELVSTAGAVFWKGAMANPSVRHVEYEDPPHSGQLRRKAIPLDEAEFTVRVPVVPGATRVDFYKLDPPASAARNIVSRKLLGSIACP